MLPAFLAILLSLLVAQTSAACEQGISFRGGPCSCYSGYTGSDCSVNSAGSCNITTPVDYLTTEIVAEFKKSWSTISNNYFTFTLVSNPRLNRTFVSIAANNETTCAYPSPTFFTRTFNTTSCQDTFVGNISIPDLVQTCTFTRTEETGRTVLSGSIRVTAIDPLGDFRGQSLVRTTNSILKLRLNLPTLYNVTSQPLTLYSAINLLSAVTLQEYDPNTDTATIEITSSLQWPYQLSAPTLEINPYASTAGFGVNFAILDVAGCETANAPCTQVSRLTITGVAASKTCVFSGLYALSWAYGFRSGASPAELPANPTVKTNVTLASDNVCTEIQIDARLSADIQSYSDATFAATKLAYLAGNTIFFKASVTADVNVNSVSVANLWINIGNTTTVTLVANSAPSLTYASANFNGSLGNTSPSEVGFSFVATFGEDASNIFSSTNRDAVFSFQVQAELQVSYVTSFKKRDVEIENIVVKKQVVLDTFAIRRAGQNALPAAGAPAAVFETPNSASGLTFGLAAPLVVGVAGALAANN